MARQSKSATMVNSHISKDDLSIRLKVEEMLKGTDDKVYNAPSGLNKETQAIYKELVELLKPIDLLSDLDVNLLVVTSDSIYQMSKAREDINKNGQVIHIRDKEGNITKVSKNPSIDVLVSYEKIFRAACSQLSLSPSARAKLGCELAAFIKELKAAEEEEKEKILTKEDAELSWLMAQE